MSAHRPTTDAHRLERTSDENLPDAVDKRAPTWAGTARAILEFGEPELEEGVVTEQAVAVLLLTREVRRLRDIPTSQTEFPRERAILDGIRADLGLPATVDVYANLHWEDDHGNAQTVVNPDEFDPAVVYPGATIRAGTEHGHQRVRVLRTELHAIAPGGVERVLITLERLDLE